ncbi:radical SAM protein [bacterium]|nr:radical SAM protein [bacterium]
MTADSYFLLVNPYIVDVAAYDLWNRPLGLLYISSILKKNHLNVRFMDLMDRYDTYFNDVKSKEHFTGKYYSRIVGDSPFKQLPERKFRYYGLPEDEFRRRLSILPVPSAILLTSGMTYWYRGVEKTASILKEHFPETKIFLGGTAANLDPDTYEKMSVIDRVFSSCRMDELYGAIKAVTGDDLDYTPDTHLDFPLPDWNIYKIRHAAAVQASWGCVHKCTYCASSRLHPEFIQRDPRSVFEELLELDKLGFSDIAFYDDAILANSSGHIEKILELIIASELTISFHIPNAVHPEFVSEKNAKLMYSAGVKTVAIGFDTESVQKRQKKKYPVEKALEYLLSAGFDPAALWCYLLVGLPGQETGEIIEAMEKIHRLKARIRLAWFSPIPGTKDFEGIEKDAGPDYYNNSFYSVVSGTMDRNTQEQLKSKERELNRGLYA